MSHAPAASATTLLDQLGGLHDASRLRLLVLLDAHELAVGELAAAIQSPQSTVSRHLKRLLESGWIQRRSVGPQALYRRTSTELEGHAKQLWAATVGTLANEPTHTEDLRRVREILTQRHIDTRAYFGATGGDWADVRERLFGSTIVDAWFPAMLDPSWRVADLGCGTGQLASVIAPWVSRVEAVDREPAMLNAARKRLSGVETVHFHEADMRSLPIDEGSIDLAILSLVLHHVEDPRDAIEAGVRLLRPGGRFLVIDMVAHDRVEYRDTMGHLHLGFDESAMRILMQAAGIKMQRYVLLRPDPEAMGPGLFAATATLSA
jgi:SAM-dependent methyltransferase/predicted transcriptional regulator